MALLAQSFRATLPQTNNQLRASSNTRNQATIQDGRVVVQNVQGRQNQNQNQRYVARGNGAAGNGGHRIELGMPMQPKRPQNSDYFKDKMLLMQAQENGAVLDEEELLFLAGEQGNTFDADVDNQPVQDLALNEDNIFQADECDAFDSDVDDEPTAQTIFMANLSSAGLANPQAGPSNASILSEVHTLENAIDHSVTNQDEHEIHNEVQQSNVIDSTSVYMGNNNVIPYEQYLSVNNISVVPSCASSTLNNVCVSSDNDAFVPHDPIANELKIYKEQVAIYEQRAKFELTKREQRMDDQMRMLIQNRNKMEENLKKELHSVKLQLNSTMENNKIIEGTVTTLKQELKQKESKFLTDFSNLKHLNDKLENKLHSQDQSIQILKWMLNPTQAKKAQPALYDGDELLKPHHVPVIVPSSEEELELAEATRNKLHVKMNDSACVEKRVNITPPNYSKENFMATFTPQTQLTPEQVFWSLDLAKRKAEELKANAPPLPVLPPATVYPPNTPVHLVPRTLPTTSQVNIGLYVITQLFWDFEKTCKKRITPTGITEGERGFEQTKWCFLTEVIPFFNLLKEHFEGIQKSLVTEVRAMKAVFENLEAEVDQNEIDLLSGEIERKNLLITNENLIAECLSKDVFYTATDSVLNVSRFSDMHDAFTIAQKRIADLESKNFNLRNKIQNDDHDSMIKHFSKLEVEHFNLQLKYQNLKECFGNKKPVTSSDAPSFDSLFVIGKLNEQIQSRGNTIRELKEKISRLTEKNSDADPTLDLKALVSQNKDLTAKLNALHDLNERFRAENAKVKQHYKELSTALKSDYMPADPQETITPVAYNLACTNQPDPNCNWGSNAASNIMTGDRSRLRNFMKKFIKTVRFGNDHFGAIMGYGDYVIGDSVISRVYYVEGLGHNLFSIGQFCDSDLEVAFRKHTCFVRDLDGVDLIKGSRGTNLYTISVEDMMRSSPIFLLSKASKNKPWLWHRRLNHLNFGTLNDLARKDLVRGLPRLKFKKDHLCSACQIGNSRKATHKPKMINTITEFTLLHMDLCGPVESAESIKWEGIHFGNSRWNTTVYMGEVFHRHYPREDHSENSLAEWLCDRRNASVDSCLTMRIFSKAPLFLLAKAVAYCLFTQNRIPLTEQTAPVHSSSGPAPNLLTPGPISSGLVPNSAPAIPYVPPTNKDLELLFQPMFDEYFETPTGDHQMPHVPAAPTPAILTGPSVSISFDHDAPSGSHSPSSSAHQSSSVHHDPNSEASSSGVITITAPNQSTQPHEHLRKWTDSHPLDNIIGNPSRPVSTRKQLATDALWCFYNSVLSKVEQKNFKSGVTEDCWFQAMQYEIHEFDRLDVCELVPPPDCAMIICFSRWIYKVKLDEYGDVLKTRQSCSSKGYRPEKVLILKNLCPVAD
ncbi:retrovirus-related pol polyprotein from transposon TNT 1-94 [Tanacetum coccineum]